MMVVPESGVNNIMGGLESAEGVRLHNHRRKLRQRYVLFIVLFKYIFLYMQELVREHIFLHNDVIRIEFFPMVIIEVAFYFVICFRTIQCWRKYKPFY